jgi:glycosyltransferase involved in cell wall biosynthesis
MYIVMHVGGMPFDGDTIKNSSLGGSETAAYYLALELAKHNHHVSVFTNLRSDKTKIIDGVRYSWSGEVTKENQLGHNFTYFAQHTPHDVCIIQRHPQAFARRYASTINLLWLHDLALYRYAPMLQSQLWNVDGVLTVSEFHKKQTMQVYEIGKDVVFPIQNGIDKALFSNHIESELVNKYKEIFRNKKTLLYSSRPERGLINLVMEEGIMAKLGDDYHLFVCSYENNVSQMQSFYGYLDSKIVQLPNVTNVGPLIKKDLAALMQNVKLLVYPTNFEEVSCITAMEAMAAGLPMLTSDHAALKETCKDSGTKLLPLKNNEVDVNLFVKEIRSFFNSEHRSKMQADQFYASNRYTWDLAGLKLLKVINTCYSRITKDARMLNAMRVSDIMRLDTKALPKNTAVGRSTYLQRVKMYSFTEDKAGIFEHYNDKKEEFKREVPRNTPRYEITVDRIEEYILQELQKGKNLFNILDVGGNIGHYAIGLVQDLERRLKDLTSTSIKIKVCIKEVSEKAQDFGNEWIRSEKLHSKVYYFNPACHEGYTFDIILLGEIVEHVVKPTDFTRKILENFAVSNTFTLVTLPYGPWEAQQYQDNDPHREHLWHFSRKDLELMYGGQPEYKVSCLPYGQSVVGEPLGNYVISFKYDPSIKIGLPERVQSLYMPRESVSLCMIVKDGESVLRKCLDSCIDLVDEVFIGVDKATTDDTIGVITRYTEELEKKNNYCPITYINIVPAVDIGFDAARNQIIQHASCDWILWLDADEVIFGLNNLVKYLRPNQYKGYLIKQQHFSVEPAGILRTDFPVKIFRRDHNVKFYGVVHEHPGVDPNKGVGKSTIIPDVVIKHDGYLTEGVRRARFHRNVQLMIRDREKYPERTLGLFLWLRDISHMCKFELERNGNQITNEIIFKAKRGIELWEELLKKADVRMLIDALEYYTNFVNVLGGGFEMSLAVSASKGNGASTLKDINSKTNTAKFLTTEHAEQYMQKVFNAEVKNYDDKYF